MTRRYTNELNRLTSVYEAARKADIEQLCRTIDSWMDRPMVMVGSGGSFSTASFASYLHERHSGKLTRSATPLDVVTGNFPDAGMACFSASGRNRDIIAAFREASRSEVVPLSALVLEAKSPLAVISEKAQYTNLIEMPDSVFSDGFLAVASLFASCLLLVRAYRKVLDVQESEIPDSLSQLIENNSSILNVDQLKATLDVVTERAYVSVLHTLSLAPAGVDLESRFVEAALGALHIADLRNFGHGRHVWLAKRAESTGVLALIGDGLGTLADKTLTLLPKEAPVERIDFTGCWDLQALAGVVVGLHVAESAGRSIGIDPGKPGVPSFGRALYRLAPQASGKKQAELNQEAALRRKRRGIHESKWLTQYKETIANFNSARFHALVADYDGTLCETNARFDPLRSDIADELTRLCESGARIGIATGRGPSAGKELRRAIPPSLYEQVQVGYYNGAEIRSLADESDPIVSEIDPDHPLLQHLREDLFFSDSELGTTNVAQISVKLQAGQKIDSAVSRAQYLLNKLGLGGEVVASSHSIDILLQSQSKQKVVEAVLDSSIKEPMVLRLGDRGCWPGNDAALLDDPFGLSVDEVSQHSENCWALAPAGVVGIQATLYYLKRLTWSKSGGRIRLTEGARG